MVSGFSEWGGMAQARVAGMHARFLDMLHDAGDEDVAGAVADRVDIDFHGVMQEAVDQDGIVAGDAEQFARLHARFQLRFVGDDDHAAAAEHIGWAQDDRIADLSRRRDRFFRRHGGRVARLLEAEVVQQHLEALAVFGEVDRVGAGAQDRHARIDAACWRA